MWSLRCTVLFRSVGSECFYFCVAVVSGEAVLLPNCLAAAAGLRLTEGNINVLGNKTHLSNAAALPVRRGGREVGRESSGLRLSTV